MRFLCIVIIFILTCIQNSWGNLYNCESTDGEPKVMLNSTKNELKLSHIPLITNSTELNRENLEFKSPYLIYYAIDSTEAFMQYSVRYEIAKLQESCKKNANVQFVAFLNSLYVEKNSFIICKDKKVNIINLSAYANINNNLNIKKNALSKGDHTKGYSKPFSYQVLYSKETNKAFAKYPLAHPDFLHDLINFVTTEDSFFPNDRFAPFLNLKSHGSEENILAGMHRCQSKAKEMSSLKILEKILTKQEQSFLKKLDTPAKVENELIVYGKLISKLDLGEARGIGSFKEKDSNLGEMRLGEMRLNITQGGLGVNEGLGAKYSFGTSHVHLSWVLEDLFPSGSNRSLGILMLESCETNRIPTLFQPDRDNILSFYTAMQSLWYRNLNWWELLEKAKGSTGFLFGLLKEETSKIPNIEVVTK